MFKNIVQKLRSQKRVPLKEGTYLFQSNKVNPIYNIDGKFSIFVGNKAQEFLWDVAKLNLEVLKPIPERIFEKCQELGLLRPMPLHCWVDSQPVANHRGSNLLLAKVEPPMPFYGGALIDRSVVFFEPSIRHDIEIMRHNNQTMTDLMAASGKDGSSELLDTQSIVHAELKMAFAHELVHAFATDEYFGMLDQLGLDLLELLTDAIGVVTFYGDYKAESQAAKHGFTRGFAYIANEIRRQNPMVDIGVDQMVELMFAAAKATIEYCKTALSQGDRLEIKDQGA